MEEKNEFEESLEHSDSFAGVYESMIATEFEEPLEHSDSFAGVYESMITTEDNPFDPFEDFNQWYLYDEEKGYHTCAYLGRIVRISDDMSDEEVLAEIERAIDEIIYHDVLAIYRKVKRPRLDDEEEVEVKETEKA